MEHNWTMWYVGHTEQLSQISLTTLQLVPQPSADPSDPLVSFGLTQQKRKVLIRLQNWNKGWKFSAMGLATAVSFAQAMGPLSLAPMFPNLMEAFHSDLAGVVQFTGVCILVLGFSNFIWFVPPH